MLGESMGIELSREAFRDQKSAEVSNRLSDMSLVIVDL